jgi:carboxylesterase
MPQPPNLDPSAYAADKGPVGALLIHGYTGSVAETRPMGEYLAAQGFSVRCPLLPGHGTTPEDLTRIRWQDWAAEVGAALQELQDRCKTVFVGGLSLGSLLALWLGVEHPEVAGLIPMAPIVKVRNRLLPLTLVFRYFLKYNPSGGIGDEDLVDPEAIQRVWDYDETPLWGASELYLLQREVRSALSQIQQPVLIFQGRHDGQLPPESAQMVHDGVSSADRTLIWLEHSGHNLLVDGEREAVWQQSHAWMLDRLPQSQQHPHEPIPV